MNKPHEQAIFLLQERIKRLQSGIGRAKALGRIPYKTDKSISLGEYICLCQENIQEVLDSIKALKKAQRDG
jgi:hypothetical protein